MWKKVHEVLSDDCVRGTEKHSPSLMVWGVVSRKGAGPLVVVEGSEDSTKYVDVLAKHYYPYMVGSQFRMILQEDNAPSHMSGYSKWWKRTTAVNTLDSWPANSPDLNLIENVWDYIGNVLKIQSEPPASTGELERRIRQIWNTVDEAFMERLYDSMERRVEAVIAAKGGSTKY